MNKSGYQPMPVLLRAEPGEGRPTSDSAKILRVVATVGGVFALCGAVAICLVGFNAFPSKSGESKAPVGLPIQSETKALAPVDALALAQGGRAIESKQDDGAALQPTDAAQVQRATPAEDHPVNEPAPTPALNPSSPPAPMVNPEAAMSDKELLEGGRPEAQQIDQGRHLWKSHGESSKEDDGPPKRGALHWKTTFSTMPFPARPTGRVWQNTRPRSPSIEKK